MSAANFDFIFESEDSIDYKSLRQGDLLDRTPALSAALGQAHSYYATSADYSHFMVLTQSCDLVRRGSKGCKSRYITICAVRPLVTAVSREFERYRKEIAGCPIPIGDKPNESLARQYLERIVNNTVDGIFFIPNGTANTVKEHLCAFLPLSIALRSSHYDVCLDAKVAQVKEIFSAKIGSLASNLYSRIATPDIRESNDQASVDRFMNLFISDLEYGRFVWLNGWEQEELKRKLEAELKTSKGTIVSELVASQIIDGLPSASELVANSVINALVKKSIISDNDSERSRAFNAIMNNGDYARTIKKIAPKTA